MNAEQLAIWEEELFSEIPGSHRKLLNRMLEDDQDLQVQWKIHRRLVIRLAGLATHDDTAARVLSLIRSQRESRRHRLLHTVQRRRQSPGRRTSPWVVATASVLISIFGLWMWNNNAVSHSPQLWRDGKSLGIRLEDVEYFDKSGEMRWADGSRAILMQGTRVTAAPDRGFHLIDGKIAVSVTPDPHQHFTITSDHARIEVLGTRFDVTARSSGTHVAVTEGIVAISTHAHHARKITAGELWFASSNGEIQRLQSQWDFQPETFKNGYFELGTLRDGLLDSGQYRDGDVLKPCIHIEAPPNEDLFNWQPGQTLYTRIRIAGAQHQKICVQLYDRLQKQNFHVYVEVNADAQGWANVEANLDELAPYDTAYSLPSGAGFGHLVLIFDSPASTFQVDNISVWKMQ